MFAAISPYLTSALIHSSFGSFLGLGHCRDSCLCRTEGLLHTQAKTPLSQPAPPLVDSKLVDDIIQSFVMMEVRSDIAAFNDDNLEALDHRPQLDIEQPRAKVAYGLCCGHMEVAQRDITWACINRWSI